MKKKFVTVLIALLLIAVSGLSIKIGMSLVDKPQVTQVEQIFADVNGDGELDLIIKADVILNTGQENFLVSRVNP